MCEALTFLLDNIYIRFGSKLYRQIVGIPKGTNCAHLVADLFLFCYETSCCPFRSSLSPDPFFAFLFSFLFVRDTNLAHPIKNCSLHSLV